MNFLANKKCSARMRPDACGICLLKQTASGAQSVTSPSKIEGFREFEADLSALFCNRKNYQGGIYMWILYAVGSSFFAGITSILAKCGIQKTDSDVATAVRTIVVLLFSWLMVFVTGTMSGIKDISGMTLLFLVLSGLATGASWLCISTHCKKETSIKLYRLTNQARS